ncbi:serologically defined colon cancer antigen 8 homolog [Mercenaria mercenaria]|uniref:serologically defined colon cancer antigen 8 homolog n=1 Tax=Mercenaria mercenaria TaxID=6596 RepID=UPI00234F302A|nr:serologically defined colon cancer antigen 8 homolog [Mercenaria mercenaria]
MYAYTSTGDDSEAYQRAVRERANASLHELDDVLTHSPNATLNTSTRAKEQLSAAVNPRNLRWYESEARPQKYKDAASHLQNILKDETQTTFQSPPRYSQPPNVPRGPLPSPEETASLLQQQTAYVNQIEAENRYMKDEFATVRIKIRDILEENQRLHEELKKSAIEEINMDAEFQKITTDIDRSMEADTSLPRGNVRHWQLELEKLGALHAAKTERLEAQLAHSREEIQRYEQIVEDLRGQVRMHDAVPTHEDGLSDMYLSEAQRGFQNSTIDRLTRERNDLLEVVANLKHRLTEMSQREEEAYQQMKKGIELVEQAQLEQTQALIQREQLAEELNNMKGRFDAHIQNTQQVVNEEKESARKECKVVIDEQNTKIKELTEQTTSAQNEMEKALRDKVDLINQLEAAKLQIKRYDQEVSMATENFNAESTNAKIQKSHAVNEASRLRSELDNLRRERDGERSRLLSELDDFRRRLNKAERELVNSKEECIHLTANSQALERELHLAKLARDSVERGRSEDLKAVTKRAQAREEELSGFITDMEDQHSQTTSEMDTMLAKQNKLIKKLKTECRKQAGQLEEILKKNRAESGKLKRQNDELKNRVHRSTARLKDLEDQVEQHSRVQERMTERLKMMDDHSQHQGTQVMELLTRQQSLMRDRQVLARELEFLRRNISRNNQEEISNFVSSNKLLVDEVLDNVRTDEFEKKENYVTKTMEKIDINDL